MHSYSESAVIPSDTCRSMTARPRRPSMTIFTALVPSRLDSCNAVLAGLLDSALALFQRVLHAAALTVLNLKPRDCVTPALRELHWSPIAERIQYELCLLVHKSLLGHTPEYISDLLTSIFKVDLHYAPHRVAKTSSCRGHVDELATEPFLLRAAPRAWNRLPTELKLLRSTDSFSS